MSGIIQLTTTVETQEQAERIARTLVERQLAGCVQVDGPISSHYEWKGQICQTSEYRLTVKSTAELVPRLKQVMAELHPYKVPQILIFAVQDSSTSYANWLRCQIQPEEGKSNPAM